MAKRLLALRGGGGGWGGGGGASASALALVSVVITPSKIFNGVFRGRKSSHSKLCVHHSRQQQQQQQQQLRSGCRRPFLPPPLCESSSSALRAGYLLFDISSRRPIMAAAAGAAARAPASSPLAQVQHTKVKVAVGQMTASADLDANYRICARLVKEAAAAGAKLLSLPECFSFIGSKQGEALTIAEPIEGPVMGRYKELAKESGIWLALGGFQEKGPDETHSFNTHVLLDDSGVVQSVYRKIHLFDVDVPGGPVLKESEFTAPGSEVVVADSPIGRLGITICYDLRFPELYQNLRFNHNAQVMLVPSAFTKTTGEAHWETLLRARAIETQCYVIAAAQAGVHNEKRESYGDAIIIDPWGVVIGRCSDKLVTGIAVADIDLGLLEKIRIQMPVGEHRRYDIYGIVQSGLREKSHL